jgi:hypothetical protein
VADHLQDLSAVKLRVSRVRVGHIGRGLPVKHCSFKERRVTLVTTRNRNLAQYKNLLEHHAANSTSSPVEEFQAMADVNVLVEQDKRDAADVARQFLRERGLVSPEGN